MPGDLAWRVATGEVLNRQAMVSRVGLDAARNAFLAIGTENGNIRIALLGSPDELGDADINRLLRRANMPNGTIVLDSQGMM